MIDELLYWLVRSIVILADKEAKPEVRAFVCFAWSMILLLAVLLGSLWLFG